MLRWLCDRSGFLRFFGQRVGGDGFGALFGFRIIVCQRECVCSELIRTSVGVASVFFCEFAAVLVVGCFELERKTLCFG